MEVTMEKVVDQIKAVYLSGQEWDHKNSDFDAALYFNTVFNKDRIVYHLHPETKKLLGYVESWRVNYEQWGRMVCGENFSAVYEDVETGRIAYLAGIWIHPEYRRSNVIKILKMKFFKQNEDCDYFVGEALRKTQSQPIKVFNRKDFYKKYIDKEYKNE